jgi:hypothetical protein
MSMKRSTVPAATILLGGLAALTITGCSTTQHGTGSSTAQHTHPAAAPAGVASGSISGAVLNPAGDPALAVTTTRPATAPTNPASPTNAATHSNPATHSNAATHSAPSSHRAPTTPVPAILSASVTCVVSSYEDLPGQSHVPLYTPLLTWKVANATGLALSVDDTTPGSYGTYGPSGNESLGSGCYTTDAQTTVVFSTVGGTGPRAQRTITLIGTHTTITPPPFS